MFWLDVGGSNTCEVHPNKTAAIADACGAALIVISSRERGSSDLYFPLLSGSLHQTWLQGLFIAVARQKLRWMRSGQLTWRLAGAETESGIEAAWCLQWRDPLWHHSPVTLAALSPLLCCFCIVSAVSRGFSLRKLKDYCFVFFICFCQLSMNHLVNFHEVVIVPKKQPLKKIKR